MNADQFNALYPVGTLVFAYPGFRPEDDQNARRLVTRTRTAAQLSASGDPVVWVEGEGSYICLTHVDPVSEDVWEEARAAETPAVLTPGGDQPSLNEQRLAEIAARAKKATPGPWITEERDHDMHVGGVPDGPHIALLGRASWPGVPADAEFIAHAREDVPALLVEVQRLKTELADFSGRVNELESRLCDCEPVREHNDYRRPAFYQHEAHCPVNSLSEEAAR
ncbi:hypothetical protein [Streptomyces sp. NPDC057115]|uniref:hypothetical protein n=1 Tax=Streptomyces sp. NPDC057115 TaxID=3346022 RepID=UPI00363A7D9B